jgi:DNA-binding PucR family transcriptional regulator
VVTVDHRIRDVATWIERETPTLVDLMLQRMRIEVPEYFISDDPGFPEMARESIVANLQAVADGLQTGLDQPTQLPPGAVEEALTAARERTPWTTIDRTYRIGHAVAWEQLLAEVESWQLASAERLDLLRVVSHFLFRYIDHVTGALAEVHQAERDRQIRRRERRRVSWVRDILADVSGSDSGGDYDLDCQHLAAVAWGSDGERAIAELGRRLNASVLVVPGQGTSVWGWLGARAVPPNWPDTARSQPLAADTFLALGTPVRGGDGFRLSHRQALEVARVLHRTGMRLGAYDEVSLDALVLRDERAARDFVARELGPLLHAGKRTETLLETLRVYVGSGWNAASTGAQLGVHERTIGYRLAAIEEKLGRQLGARRTELGVALRLHATLGG